MGGETSLTAEELRSLGDAYYNAGRYQLAVEQYRALARNMTLPVAERNEFEVAVAACDLKLKLLTEREAEALPDSNDGSGGAGSICSLNWRARKKTKASSNNWWSR